MVQIYKGLQGLHLGDPIQIELKENLRDQGITKFLISLHFLEMMRKQPMNTFLGLQSNVESYQTMGMENL
jgi:hypothetical protein